jgi:hypothetical protein
LLLLLPSMLLSILLRDRKLEEFAGSKSSCARLTSDVLRS